MIAPGNDLIQVLLGIGFSIAICYALGRIHQWHRDGAEREQAYRNGYDLASDAMFDMAMRRQSAESVALPAAVVTTRRPAPTPYVEPPNEEAGGVRYPRRSVGDSRRRIPGVRPSSAGRSRAAHRDVTASR